METIEIHATKDQLEDFKESVIWNDISRELESWKEGFEMEMRTMVDDAAETNPSTASFLLHHGDLNGRIKAVDYLLSLVDVFIQIKSTEKDEEEEEDLNE